MPQVLQKFTLRRGEGRCGTEEIRDPLIYLIYLNSARCNDHTGVRRNTLANLDRDQMPDGTVVDA